MSIRATQAMLYALTAAAWLAFARITARSRSMRTLMVMPHEHHARVMRMHSAASLTLTVAGHVRLELGLMTVAMMLPASIPAAMFVAANSLKARRGRSVGLFLASYFAAWIAFVLAAVRAIHLLRPTAAALG